MAAYSQWMHTYRYLCGIFIGGGSILTIVVRFGVHSAASPIAREGIVIACNTEAWPKEAARHTSLIPSTGRIRAIILAIRSFWELRKSAQHCAEH